MNQKPVYLVISEDVAIGYKAVVTEFTNPQEAEIFVNAMNARTGTLRYEILVRYDHGQN